MPRKTPLRPPVDLRELLSQLQRVNPTGRGLVRHEEQARYAEKARLQSLLIESFPQDVRLRLHPDLPGIVSLSVPRLQASGGHAVVEALSSAARHWIETQSDHQDESASVHNRRLVPRKTSFDSSPIELAEKHLADYDFDCAITTLQEAIDDPHVGEALQIAALHLLLEIHVDHLANDDAALELEAKFRTLGCLSPRAHELLGVAASRKGDVPRALQHLSKSRGERVGAEVARLARVAFVGEKWNLARKAWAHLNAFIAATEPPLSISLTVFRNELRELFVCGAVDKLQADVAVDEELERLLRELDPQHPWYVTRRQAEQKTRADSAVRTAVQKAREAKNKGDFELVSSLLDGFGVMGLSPEISIEMDELRRWANERRAWSQASRALALAQSADLEDACHAYVNLSGKARDYIRVQGAPPLFSTLERLNAVFSDRMNTRPLLRAACAWVQAQRVRDVEAAWSIIAPHGVWFDRHPDFAEHVRSLSAQVETIRMHRQMESGRIAETDLLPHTCIEGQCFSEWLERPTSDFRIERLARHAVRLGSTWFVPSVGRLENGTDRLVSFWPCHGSAEARHVVLREFAADQSARIIGQKQRAVLLDDEKTLWLVEFANKPMVRRHKLVTKIELGDDFLFIPVDDDHCALIPGPFEPVAHPWRIVHVPSGAVRTELQGPGLHCVRSNGGATFYRLSGLCLERLDVDGQIADHFELPKNITPFAILELPGVMRPVILGTAILRSCVLAWWPSEPRFFRAFEMFDVTDHGELVEGWGARPRTSPVGRHSRDSNDAVGDGCVFAMTRRKDGKTFIHEASVVKGVFQPGGRRSLDVQPSVVLGDPTGKWVWFMTTPRPDFVDVRAWNSVIRTNDEIAGDGFSSDQ